MCLVEEACLILGAKKKKEEEEKEVREKESSYVIHDHMTSHASIRLHLLKILLPSKRAKAENEAFRRHGLWGNIQDPSYKTEMNYSWLGFVN